MGIANQVFGKHKNVAIAQFGTGDILISPARHSEEEGDSMVLLSNHAARPVGTTQPPPGKNSDYIEDVKIVLAFSSPESITVLISALVELQKSLYTKAEKQKRKETIHTTIGVYGNGDMKINGVSLENLGAHIRYNKSHRPGRALFVDGKCAHTGNLTDERLAYYEALFLSGDEQYIRREDTAPYQ